MNRDTKPDVRRLSYLIGVVAAALVHVDEACGERPQYGQEGYSFEATDAWWKRRTEAIESVKTRLAAEGAAFTFKPPHDHAIRLAGIRSSSTSGWTGAMHNWIRAAEKRLQKEAAR